MPWSSNHLPKYRKHRASGQAVVTLSGKDFYLGPYGTKASKVEYDRLIAEWLSSQRSASFASPESGITVVELIADYLTYAKDYYGGGTRGTYATMVRVVRQLTELYGRTAATEFGALQFKAICKTMIDADLSRGYINDTMSRIVAYFVGGQEREKSPHQ